MDDTSNTQPAAADRPRRKPAGASPASRKRNARSRAREFALQALYQHIVSRNDAGVIDAFTRDLSGFHKADSVHYDALLHGVIAQEQALDAAITPLLDRPLKEISPIEHAAMWMGLYEFQHAPDVPWRVVLNEYVELAKSFGGTDGHKYVNAVLHALAQTHRAVEVAADAQKRQGAAP